MYKTDIVASGVEGMHHFSEDEMSACFYRGQCCGCGFCCVSPYIEGLPKTQPKDDREVETFDKNPLTVCRHLRETHDGIFRCAFHAFKGSCDALETCHYFGGNGMGGANIGALEVMLELYPRDVMSKDSSALDLGVADVFVGRGVVTEWISASELFNDKSRRSGLSKKFYGVLSRGIYGLERLPIYLFDLMKMRDFFVSIPCEGLAEVLSGIGFDFSRQLSPNEQMFLKRYVPGYEDL